jgi:signal transduction histidine kinase
MTTPPLAQTAALAKHAPLGFAAATGLRARALLITDDDAMTRFVTLELHDQFAVVSAADGWTALERASEPGLDLIITEIAVTRMMGEDMIATVRQQPHLDALPILVLSRAADDPARSRALARGAQDYLVVPFSAEELRARATTLAGVKRLRDILKPETARPDADLETLAREVLADKQRALQALRNAEAASAAKDEFLAVLSHELRTPLNAIMGWVGILQRAGLGPREQARAMEVIERNARAQTRLVEDLLDVSAMIRGKIRLQLEPTALRPVIGEALDTARPTAEGKGIALHWHDDVDSLVVSADADRLRQVVHNLLVNAIKFTPEGGHIMVRVERRDDVVAISIEDTGAGIDPEFLPRVFERFMQGAAGGGPITRGLGLGLAIVRHLVELHGGTVEAASPGVGLGSTFTVRLPVLTSNEHRPRLSPATPSSATPLLGLRVMYVEDDEDTRHMVVYALEQYGAIVTAVASVRAALDLLDDVAPDLVLSDIGLPERDGYELMRMLRLRGRPIPAIALTAYATPDDRQAALSAGYWHHVGKPVDIGELVTAMSTVVRTKEANE